MYFIQKNDSIGTKKKKRQTLSDTIYNYINEPKKETYNFKPKYWYCNYIITEYECKDTQIYNFKSLLILINFYG